jgi:FkbM family methyltransferase
VTSSRQLAYFLQRFLLRREHLTADGLPFGMRLEVPAADDVGRRLFKYRVHEAPVLDWLQDRPAPRSGDLAIDVGANLGWYSVLLDRLSAGRLDIHAFEPDPDNRALLDRNLALNGADRVCVSDLALTDHAGSAPLHRYRSINRGKHSLRPMPGAVDAVSVRCARLDDTLREAGLGTRDIWLFKIDVEGLEPAVIRGAADSLARAQAVVLEYSPMYHEGQEGRDMLRSLADAGLRPALWDGARWASCSLETLAGLTEQRDTVWSR